MKFSIICQKFKRGGGMEQYQLELINGLAKYDIKPIVYATSFDKSIPEYQLIYPCYINVKFIPKPLRQSFISYFLKNKLGDYNVSISMSYNFSDIIICGGQHKGFLKAQNKRAGILDMIKILNEQSSLNRAKLVIAHSELMKRELIELYHLNEDKIITIYPPVNTQAFMIPEEGEREKLREKFGFKPSDIIYLFPSTGHKRKGYELLKHFFNQTELPIKLVVAGTPVKDSRNIISLGFRTDMPDLYKAADFTIMASNYEPFGLVGIESILSGTPIIFSENMACLEVLKGNFGITFDRKDEKSLHNALLSSIKLVENNQARLTKPLLNLKYDPTLENHIHLIMKVIRERNI